jgi:hypothetical protein
MEVDDNEILPSYYMPKMGDLKRLFSKRVLCPLGYNTM